MIVHKWYAFQQWYNFIYRAEQRQNSFLIRDKSCYKQMLHELFNSFNHDAEVMTSLHAKTF